MNLILSLNNSGAILIDTGYHVTPICQIAIIIIINNIIIDIHADTTASSTGAAIIITVTMICIVLNIKKKKWVDWIKTII